jgi:translocator protein
MKNTPHVATPRYASWITALPFVVGCITLGFLGSFIGGAFQKQPWYDESPKPAIWPPQWVFPTVWIGNYICMGLASWHVWQCRQKRSVGKPLTIFALHLLHNFSFIPLVYHFKQKSVYVLMDMIGLGSGLVTMGAFARVSRIAGWLMLPYMGWLCFTTGIKVLWWRLSGWKIQE